MLKNIIRNWLGINADKKNILDDIYMLNQNIDNKKLELRSVIGATIAELCDNCEDSDGWSLFTTHRNKFRKCLDTLLAENINKEFNNYVGMLNNSEDFLNNVIDRINRKQLK